MAALDEYERDFCTELRNDTQQIHDESDKLINFKLAVALTDTRIWSQAITDFYFVFRQLETSLEQLKDDERLGELYFCSQPEYRRTELFQKDLEFYKGLNWSSDVKPSVAAERYCKRLQEITQNKPILLIAYIHSMYLALLAGGALLRRIIKKTLGLSGNEGLALLSFESEPSKRAELRNRIKNTINSLGLSREEKEEIKKEVSRCFSMNNSIANSLEVTLVNYKRIAMIVTCATLVVAVTVGTLIRCLS